MKDTAPFICQGRLTRALAAFALVAAALTATLHAAGIGTPSKPPAQNLQLATGVSDSAPVHLPGRSLWEKRWWIDKTARLLRGGEGIGPDDDLEALMQLPEEAVVRRFMADPRFGDTVLDFNMFFLGFKADTLKSDGRYRSTAFDFANAVAAAQELLKGGDYFRLFDLDGPFYMAPLRSEQLEDPPQPQDVGLAPHEMRRKVVNEVKAVLNELMVAGSTTRSPNGHAYCTQIMQFLRRQDDITNRFYQGFEDAEIFVLIRAQAISSLFDAIETAADAECTAKRRARADVGRLVHTVKIALDRFTSGFAALFRFEPDVYAPQSVAEFRTFDVSVFPKVKAWPAFGHEQGIALANSSTNLNRKRAAYVLRRFFCDDLTPVGVDNPKEHVSGAHGSDTSCFACHYKLDPMAGFFRSYGSYFYDYSRSSEIIFDDLASTNRRRYESAWRAPATSSRQWNVGYIRSPRWEDQNEYGQTLADLSRIIRRAPEARRCVMKRLFEYAVAENQAIDSGYLDHLTRQFERESAINSSEAMKNAFVRIVQSKTFHERNPEPQRCYDHGSDAARDNAPPCRVAYILQKNCAQCHNDAKNGATRLDLTTWVLGPDGKHRTFPYFDAEMNQKSMQDALAALLDRLSSNDPAVRMPLATAMPSPERQELFLWAQEMLTTVAKEKAR